VSEFLSPRGLEFKGRGAGDFGFGLVWRQTKFGCRSAALGYSHYCISTFARTAQMFRPGNHLGVGSLSREGAKTPSSEKNFFSSNLCAFAPLREIFRHWVAALPRWDMPVSEIKTTLRVYRHRRLKSQK
jgi:hypothetical protein